MLVRDLDVDRRPLAPSESPAYWLDARGRYDALKLRVLWATVALSCAVHLGALFLWTARPNVWGIGIEKEEMASERLRVRLAAIQKPEPAPVPVPPQTSVAPQKHSAPPPKAARRAPLPPLPTLPALSAPIIAKPFAPAPTISSAVPRTSPPVEGDLWSYVQARRRERGETQIAAIDKPNPRPNDAFVANLPSPATGVATQTQRRGGGIFEIKRMDYDDAAFEFFGWNNEMGRNTPQLIEVRKGNNSDMRIAVVRKMIAIIRLHSQGDFVWRSPRYENGLVLSARPSDNAALESFLMRELLDDLRLQ
jgi:hypothetical protein